MNNKTTTSDFFADSSIENIKQNIKYLRKLRGLTQKQLAEKMGVTQSAVSQFESSGNLQLSTLMRLCEVLQVDQAWIYLSALYDKRSPFHDVLEHAIKTLPVEEQGEEIFKVIEQRDTTEQRSKDETDSLSSLCMSIFDSLNEQGKKEAVKRIQELAQLEQYKKRV